MAVVDVGSNGPAHLGGAAGASEQADHGGGDVNPTRVCAAAGGKGAVRRIPGYSDPHRT
jgi:hypothetical protein